MVVASKRRGVALDFAALPPEINSGRMYMGPGSGPILAAAAAWDELAAGLHSVAASYRSVISGLAAGPWSGPSSAAMTAAAASYVAWLSTAAAQAEETATQAKAAAVAYEEAFAATVPPPLIAANRSLLTTLVAKNIFGQYTATIATLEGQYAEMWARDTAAMYSYAGSSASATALTPFTNPPQTTNGSANQAAAVGQTTGTLAGNAQNTVSSIQQAFSAAPNTLQSLAAAPAAAAAAPSPLTVLEVISALITIFLDAPASLATFFVDAPLAPLAAVSLPLDIVGAGSGLHTDDIVSGWAGIEPWPFTGDQPPTEFPAVVTGPIQSPAPTPAAALSAGLGEANTVGGLSVPPTWTIATPAVRPIALTLPALPPIGVSATAAEAAAAAAEVGSGSTFSQIAAAGMAGRAMAGTLGTGAGKGGGPPKEGTRVRAGAGGTGITRESAAADARAEAPQDKPRTVVTGVAAELREFAKLRDEGILTDEEYTEQKNRLLGR